MFLTLLSFVLCHSDLHSQKIFLQHYVALSMATFLAHLINCHIEILQGIIAIHQSAEAT